MAMVCPQCNGSFEQHLQCPTCSVRLLYQATRHSADGGLAGPGGQWQHTPWGRIFVGLLLAQGLYHGLQQLCTAGVLALGDENSSDVWSTLFGLILQQGLQGFGLLVGGMLAGAGQRRGLVLGALVGLLNGLILVGMEYARTRTMLTVGVFEQPLLLLAFATIGGLVGSLIWKPLPTLTMPGQDSGKAKVNFADRKRRSPFAGPVAWVRVLIGIGVAVAGAVWAGVILNFVLVAAEGKLSIRSTLQAQLVSLEICALAVLIGSGLAGATTSNGLKQGLCVGLGASVLLAGYLLGKPTVSLDQVIFTVGSTSVLALAGGWFGGQLFPPVVGIPRRRRYPATSGV